ncbi:MAG: VacJ family lipoprotein [Pseudomonadota bacterium]
MQRRSGAALVSALGFSLILAGCATAPAEGELVYDPAEPVNRSIHSFNKGVDTVVLRPAATAYDTVTPTLVQHLLGNAFSHLSLPSVFVNQLLQGDGEEALATLGRFGVNTVVGAGGTLDPATEFGLPKENTDFGITLAKWGVGEGAYVELPFLGPSTARDTVGTIVDIAFSPTTYITGGAEVRIASATARAVEIVDARSRNAALIDDILYSSEDSYVSVRASYIQNRRRLAAGGETDVDALPDLFSQ